MNRKTSHSTRLAGNNVMILTSTPEQRNRRWRQRRSMQRLIARRLADQDRQALSGAAPTLSPVSETPKRGGPVLPEAAT